jgi:hypothetical protein
LLSITKRPADHLFREPLPLTMSSRKLHRLSRGIYISPASRTHAVLRPRTFTTSLVLGDRSSEGGDRNPQRNAQQDRQKINTDANEYAKSGTDDTAAKNEDAAFDPNITTPEGARKKAGEGNEENPLDVSPANPEVSQGTSKEP